jgi:hypothetical protein
MFMFLRVVRKLSIVFLTISCCIVASLSYADCPQGYEDMGVSNVYGQSKIKIDWIGKKAVTKRGVVSVSGSVCFAENGKKCVGDGFGVVLNTGSETETIPVDGSANKTFSICMNGCSRTKEVQLYSDESPDWNDIPSCRAEFKVQAVN